MTTPRASWRARVFVWLARRLVKPRLERLIARAMAMQRRLSAPSISPVAGVPGEWTPARGEAVATLFYLHGGGFLIGSPRLFRYVARGFARAGFNVFAPAYRLAPEHVFPAALQDATRAYKALAAQTTGPLVIAGDSAGGGLAVSLMLRLRDEGVALPRAAALFSPWTDLAATGASARENEDTDAFFTRRAVLIGARMVLGRASAKNPLASPIYGDLTGLPPLLVHVGADETLRDDSVRLVDSARAAGVAAEIEIWPGVPHAWPLLPFLPEAAQSRDKAITFLTRQAGASAAGCERTRSSSD